MIMWRPGRVARVLREQDDIEELEVQVDGKSERALNYPVLTGRALPGDTVVLNTTAARLGLCCSALLGMTRFRRGLLDTLFGRLKTDSFGRYLLQGPGDGLARFRSDPFSVLFH